MPTRRDRVRFLSVAMAENAASCEVRGLVLEGWFSIVTVNRPNSPTTRISWTFSFPPGTAMIRTRTQLRIRHAEKRRDDEHLSELAAAVEAMKAVPWTTLQELRGDATVLKKLDEAESLLQSLRKALKSE